MFKKIKISQKEKKMKRIKKLKLLYKSQQIFTIAYKMTKT